LKVRPGESPTMGLQPPESDSTWRLPYWSDQEKARLWDCNLPERRMCSKSLMSDQEKARLWDCNLMQTPNTATTPIVRPGESPTMGLQPYRSCLLIHALHGSDQEKARLWDCNMGLGPFRKMAAIVRPGESPTMGLQHKVGAAVAAKRYVRPGESPT